MKKLLNELIKRGWKPFGWDDKLSSLHKEYGVGKWYIRFHNGMDSELFDLRQLTSKESGLRQFCVENKLVTDRYNDWTFNATTYCEDCDIDYDVRYWETNYEYRIIQSALCDEDKLEKFLLDNIKIDGERTSNENS